MIDEDAGAASAALVLFLQAFARLIAQELQQKPVQRIDEPPLTPRSLLAEEPQEGGRGCVPAVMHEEDHGAMSCAPTVNYEWGPLR